MLPGWEWRMERLSSLIAAAGLLALTILSLTTMLDIVGREVFRTPIDGFSDIADLIVVFAAASCLPISLSERHHVAVRFLGQLHWRLREILDLVGHLLLLVVFAVICWQVVLYTLDIFRSGQTTWLVRIPIWPLWVTTTLILAVCVPVQALVVLDQAGRALSSVPLPDRSGDAAIAAAADQGDRDGSH
jgi:TRAP-type C4-dicarboxylate transport system permease small subunit